MKKQTLNLILHTSRLFFVLASFAMCTGSMAQNLRNGWIDYNKTYYRFRVLPAPLPKAELSNLIDPGDYGRLMRISYSTLQQQGLAGTPVEQFQLWRNGVEVPLLTQPATGLPQPDSYLEFWAVPNDGTTDTDLYASANDQPNKRWSLYADSSTYFLTVNASGANKRFNTIAHDPINSATTAENWFTHQIQVSPHNTNNKGYALFISGSEIRSSRYDAGEGWSTSRYGGESIFLTLGSLQHDPSAASVVNVTANVQVFATSLPFTELRMNDAVIRKKQTGRYRIDTLSALNQPVSILNGAADSTTIAFRLETLTNSVRINLNGLTLSYPRKFSFKKSDQRFAFSLPASGISRKLKMVDFDASSGAEKVLLDLTNNRRYVGVVQDDTTWFEILPNATASNFILASYLQTPPDVSSSFVQRNFQNLNAPSNQGNYLLISHPALAVPLNGENQVEAYRSFRASSQGGSYAARSYMVDELYDQFAYGIDKHSIAIRNFIRYAKQNYPQQPKAVFLLGRGATYNYDLSDPNAQSLNLVPTWGFPAGDNLFATPSTTTAIPDIPIGRVAAITPQEVKDYLDKVKAHAAEQQNTSLDHSWQKQTLHLIGGNDASIVQPIKSLMEKYEKTIEDTLSGASVKTFLRVNNPNISEDNLDIRQSLQNGSGLISYFGHSSNSSIDFNLNQPEELPIAGGRYPVFLANGCSAADFFNLSALRYNQQKLSLSEKFVITPGAGSIAFLSSTHYGILQYLDLFTNNWYKALATTQYGKTLGEIHQTAITKTLEAANASDVQTRLTCEEYLLHGDPAIKLYTQAQPDYAIESIKVSPAKISMLSDTVQVEVVLTNSGAAINAPARVRVVRDLEAGGQIVIADSSVAPLTNSRKMTYRFPVKTDSEVGNNIFTVTIDPANLVAETNESNNSSSLNFKVESSAFTPISPLNYGIVTQWPVALTGHAASATNGATDYRLQIDTTITFNSPLLYQEDQNISGVTVSFSPANSLLANTVYYWRVAPLVNGNPAGWSNASFEYDPGGNEGFHQKHFYQHQNSTYKNIYLKPEDRWLHYTPRFNNLYFFHGVYPTASTEDGQLSITRNGVTDISSACVGRSLIINVFDSLSFIPWKNSGGDYGTGPVCGVNRQYNFEISYFPASNRKKLMDLIDLIPTGNYVAIRLVLDADPGQPRLPDGKADSAMVEYWKRDTAIYGSGQSLYHRLVEQGFYGLDEMNSRRTFSFAFRKNDTSTFKPKYSFSDGMYDIPVLSVDLPMTDTSGTIASPWFGPAANWQQLQWRGKLFTEPNGLVSDSATLFVIGKRVNNQVDTLYRLPRLHQDVQFTGDSAIDASTYPFMQLVLQNHDSDNATPYPLENWKVLFTPRPDGTVNPQGFLRVAKQAGMDTEVQNQFEQTDSIYAAISFANSGSIAFTDSIYWRIVVEDSIARRTVLANGRARPLAVADTIIINSGFPITGLGGNGHILFEINRDRPQSEITLANNVYYVPIRITPPPFQYAPNLKTYNGTGNWSDGGKWTPVGVPVCNDKVIINGTVTVDIPNAVCDTMWLNTPGEVKLLDNGSKLQLGCSSGGGKSILNVKGKLTVADGFLEINGALRISEGANVTQTGGKIKVDANRGTTNGSAVFAAPSSISAHPAAVVSIGGWQAASDTLNQPFTNGTINFSGGQLIITDPPYGSDGYAFFWNNTGTSAPLFTGNHILQFGATTGQHNSADPSTSQYKLYTLQSGGTAVLSLQNLNIADGAGGARPTVVSGSSSYELFVKGLLDLHQGSSLKLAPGIKITIQQ